MENFVLDGTRMLIALGVGIVFLMIMILKTKIHTFLALIITAVFVGIAGGMPQDMVISAISSGFGSTLGSIGIIIGFGVMMGQIFEATGAAKTMANTFIKKLGVNKEEEALAITGFLVSIPIYCDSGFVILASLIKALSKASKKSIVSLAVCLAGGLVITHSLVPPTPGPVGAAGIFGANVGLVIIYGMIIAVPMLLAVLAYGKWLGNKIYQIPGEDGEWIRPALGKNLEAAEVKLDEELPSATKSFMPIIVPIILILLSTVSKALGVTGQASVFFQFFGTPIVAVAIGLLLAIFTLASHMERREVIKVMEVGIESAGIIILITGAGGALGQVLRDSGVGNHIAEIIKDLNVPHILLPFIIATIIRFIQGSGTVAMLTAASITAPIMASLNVNTVMATLSACVGSLFFSYFNDSFFNVVNRTIGIEDPKEQIRVWSITTTIAWAVGLVALLILNMVIG
ncbi:GntP family permease [Peptoniphilus duerdenii]|uniref:GntP family permease n=1 Tax=Peptoniphilus duerdenii TaxID=507750 RepID=UPI002889BAA9|nr:gluconate:H+ symporter [Peptoniphilus duerdenii]